MELEPLFPKQDDAIPVMEVDLERQGNAGQSDGTKGTSTKRVYKEYKQDSSDFRQAFLWLWSGSRYSGALCITLSSVAYSLMSFSIEAFTVQQIPYYESMFMRCAMIALICFVSLKWTGEPIFQPPRPMLILGALTEYLAMSGFCYSMKELSTQEASLLSYMSPMFTAVLAKILLKEKWGVKEMIGGLCSFIGVVFILDPAALLSGTAVSGPHYKLLVASAVGLVAALLGAVSDCVIGAVGKSGESALSVLLVYTAISCPLAGICMLMFQEFVLPSFPGVMGMIIVSLIAFAAQILLVHGFQLERLSSTISLQHISVAITFGVGVMLRPADFSLPGLLGSILITSSLLFTLWYKTKILE